MSIPIPEGLARVTIVQGRRADEEPMYIIQWPNGETEIVSARELTEMQRTGLSGPPSRSGMVTPPPEESPPSTPPPLRRPTRGTVQIPSFEVGIDPRMSTFSTGALTPGARPTRPRRLSGALGEMEGVRRHLTFEESEPFHVQSYQTLMKQLYGQPVTLPVFLIINQLRTPFVTYEEAQEKLNRGEIERYVLDPLTQPWAGLPGTRNRILTLIGKDGRVFLVKAVYDGQKIYPPQ